MATISDKYITKIEGHGSLEIDWNKNLIELNIHEGERLFEGILVGRTIEESHWITPRICGVCPIAHNLASLQACEDGLNIKISETSSLLRSLMICAQMMQSHMLHLFFLSLPDYLGIDRGTELNKKDPKSFQAALDVKEVSDEIARIVAGRNIHPTRTTIGGFHKIPAKKELKNLLELAKKTRKSAEHALKLCTKLEYPELKVELEFIAQKDEQILSSAGENSSIHEYKQVIDEEIRNYSTAKFGKYKGREIMVGSLARLFFLGKNNPQLIKGMDFKNPFHNNLAQAVELLEYHKQAEEILSKLLKSDSSTYESDFAKTTTGKGIGAVEAPRGGLYHEIHFDEDGIITYANIITPTVQNLTSIEKSANALLEQCGGQSRKEIEHLLEMLVRAYDPCITCSVH